MGRFLIVRNSVDSGPPKPSQGKGDLFALEEQRAGNKRRSGYKMKGKEQERSICQGGDRIQPLGREETDMAQFLNE